MTANGADPAGPELVRAAVAAATAAGALEDGLRAEIARQLGVTRQLVDAWERGVQPVSAALAPRLRALATSPIGAPPAPGSTKRLELLVPQAVARAVRGARTAPAIRAYIDRLERGERRRAAALAGDLEEIRLRVAASDLVRLVRVIGPGLPARAAHIVEALRQAAEQSTGGDNVPIDMRPLL